MARRKNNEEKGGGAPAWMSTYGDMVTLLLCFFVLLFSMSSIDMAKFKAAISSFANQIDIMPGGEALTDGELLSNGISQLNDVQIIFQGGMAVNEDGDSTKHQKDEKEKDKKDEQLDLTEEAKMEKAKEIAEKIDQGLREQNINTQINVAYSPNYVKLTIRGEYLFDSGKADLKPDAIQAIGVLAGILSSAEYKPYRIQVEGHTDNRPINTGFFKNNRYLSAARAIAVEEELVNVHGYDPRRVSSTGYGEYHPIANNDTPEGQRLNRRVEVKLLLEMEEKELGEKDLITE